MGVSTGTSYISAPHAIVNAASAAAPATRASDRLWRFGLGRTVIDFLEQIVVLTNLCVVRLDRERLFVRLPRFVELPFVLVANAEVVIGGGVHRVDFDRFFPAIDGFAPQAALGDVDSELHLFTRARTRVGPRGHDADDANADDEQRLQQTHVRPL